MKIESIKGKNFLRLGEFEFALHGRGLVAIQGKNLDDTSAESNGAGKSSLLDAIAWTLYGYTARGLSGDKVVNNIAKKHCVASAQIVDGTNRYTITRARKPSKLEVKAVDINTGAEFDLTKGTEAETQEVIARIVGCSLDVFLAAVYAGQESMPDLPGMTDKQLKVLVEEAAGIEVLDRAYALARENAAEAREKVMRIEVNVAAALTELNNGKAQLERFKLSSDQWEEERAKNMEEWAAQARHRQQRYLELAKQVEEGNVAEILNRLHFLQGQIDGVADEQIKLNRLTQAEGLASGQANTAAATLERAMALCSQLQNKLKNVEAQVGTKCGHCGSTIAMSNIEHARSHIQAELEAALVAAAKAQEGMTEAISQEQRVRDAKKTFLAKMTDMTAVVLEQRTLTAKRDQINAISANAQQWAVAAKEMVEKVRMLKNQANPFTDSIAQQQAFIDSVNARIAALGNAATEAQQQLEIAEDAVRVFSPAGVRAHVLDTVTPFLNERTADYLGVLTDGAITAVWSTLGTTAKGELREKFNIDVSHQHGSDNFVGLSGGEKRKVRLACYMALQDMVATRATKPIDLFMADEIDQALDDAGLERLMGLLEKKARERGTVLVVSHHSLSDWIDNVVTVVKEGGFSRIEESC